MVLVKAPAKLAVEQERLRDCVPDPTRNRCEILYVGISGDTRRGISKKRADARRVREDRRVSGVTDVSPIEKALNADHPIGRHLVIAAELPATGGRVCPVADVSHTTPRYLGVRSDQADIRPDVAAGPGGYRRGRRWWCLQDRSLGRDYKGGAIKAMSPSPTIIVFFMTNPPLVSRFRTAAYTWRIRNCVV